MNFAVPALLIILILLPGVIARTSYLRGQWDTHPFRSGAIFEEIAYGSFAAIILHILAIFVVSKLGYLVKLDLVMALLYGPSANNSRFDAGVTNLSNHAGAVCIYLVSLYALSWVSGYLMHGFVRISKLDLQMKVFRFSHDWHYLLSGEILDFDRQAGPFESIRFSNTLVAILMGEGDHAMIYRGRLRRYHFSSDGQLDRLVLEHPQRASFKSIQSFEANGGDPEKSADDLFVQIDGHFLLVNLAEVVNINILFVTTN